MRSPAARMTVRIAAIVLSAAGIWISHYLALQHVKASPGVPQAAAPAAEKAEASFLDQACTAVLETADCDEVLASAWGEMTFAGIRFPTALLGLYYFTALFFWFALIGQVSGSRTWVHILLACFMAVGLGMSVLFMYQMLQLEFVCLLCIATHVINLLLFGCMLALWPRKDAPVAEPAATSAAPAGGTSLFAPLSASPAASRGDWPHWWMLAVTPVVILLAMGVETLSLASRAPTDPRAVQQLQVKLEETEGRLERVARERELYRRMSEQHDVSADLEEFRAQSAAQIEQLEAKVTSTEQAVAYWRKRFDWYNTKWQHNLVAWQLSPPVMISQGERVRGPADARHTATIFSDFQCPTCREFEHFFTRRIVPLAAQHGGLRVEFKHWPISTGCNPHATRDLHPAACAASLAAEAALMVGGVDAFWKMHDLLFEKQQEWRTSMAFDGYARQIGLNVEAFQAAMKSEEAMRRVMADVEEGAALGGELVAGEHIPESDREFLKVDSTPSVYFNNKKMASLGPLVIWQHLLRQPPPQAPAPAVEGAADRPDGPSDG